MGDRRFCYPICFVTYPIREILPYVEVVWAVHGPRSHVGRHTRAAQREVHRRRSVGRDLLPRHATLCDGLYLW